MILSFLREATATITLHWKRSTEGIALSRRTTIARPSLSIASRSRNRTRSVQVQFAFGKRTKPFLIRTIPSYSADSYSHFDTSKQRCTRILAFLGTALAGRSFSHSLQLV